jgi:hypothetical protein
MIQSRSVKHIELQFSLSEFYNKIRQAAVRVARF